MMKLRFIILFLIFLIAILSGILVKVVVSPKNKAVKVVDNCLIQAEAEGFEDITEKTRIAFDNEWLKEYRNTYLGFDKESVNDDMVIDNMAGGVVAADFNNDGFIDLYFVSGETGHLFMSDGNLQFTEKTEESGILPYKNGTGVLAADFNNDGNIDLLLYGYKTAVALYENLGDGRFKDATKDVGLEREIFIAFGAAFGDYDKDGWLDLYIANFVDLPKTVKGEDSFDSKNLPNRLFKNNGGTFEDVTKKAGIANTYPSLAASFIDYNNDGWSDMLIANDFRPNELYRNNGNGTFTNISEILMHNTTNDNNGMGIAVGDYNNDGWLDAYTTSIYEDRIEDPGGNLLFMNQEGKKLINTAKEAKVDKGGWGWGTVPIDFNNDGLVDIAEVSGFDSVEYDVSILAIGTKGIVASRAYLFENLGNNAFREKACELGFLSKRSGRGLVAADLDNDGYLDLVINELRRFPKIYRNKGGDNNWLTIKLIGTASNKDGIGAKVSVSDGKNTYYKELYTSGTYLSSSDLRLFFGLGTVEKIREITIVWPSGSRQTIHDVSVNQLLTVTEE